MNTDCVSINNEVFQKEIKKKSLNLQLHQKE